MATSNPKVNFFATHMMPISDYPENMSCPICKDPVTEAVKVACEAEHIFCKECVSAWLTTNKTCPLDREILYEEFLEDEIRSLDDLRVELLAAQRAIDNITEVVTHLDEHLEAQKRDLGILIAERKRLSAQIEEWAADDVRTLALIKELEVLLPLCEGLPASQHSITLSDAKRQKLALESRYQDIQKIRGKAKESDLKVQEACSRLKSQQDAMLEARNELVLQREDLRNAVRYLTSDAVLFVGEGGGEAA